MKNNKLKLIGLGAFAAAGIATAAVAQQSNTQRPQMSAEQHRQMMSGGMQGGQTMNGMNADPKMHQQMMTMMENCNRMMKNMGNMSDMNMKPKT